MNIKRKLRLIFSLVSLIICFGLSSVMVMADDVINPDETATQEETTLSAEDMKTYADGKITMAQAKALVEQYANAISQYSNCSDDELEYLGGYFSYQTDAFVNFAKTVGDEKCGEYKSYDKIEVEETEDGKVDVSAMLHFEKRDLKMIMHVSLFDNLGCVPTSIEFNLPDEGNNTLLGKLQTAGGNTLLGMGVVFLVLIFISFIISCFGFIPKIVDSFGKKNKASEEAATPSESTVSITEETTDDSELIAVIAAAIAASEHTSTDSFVVRSIRRR